MLSKIIQHGAVPIIFMLLSLVIGFALIQVAEWLSLLGISVGILGGLLLIWYQEEKDVI